jgi:hypothetical protein
MTYLLLFSLFMTASVSFARFLKGRLDTNHPNVEDEAELEMILAHRLSVDLKRAVK